MDKFTVVITDCDHGSIEEEKSEMAAINARLVLLPAGMPNDLVESCARAEGIINQYALLTREFLERLPRCQVIARYGVGVDTIDLQAATDLGIIVANVPDYCIDEVADHSLALLLAVVRKTAFYDRRIKAGEWDFRPGMPIFRMRGKTMGLIGSGKIGMEVARRIASFGVRVIAYDPYLKPAELPFELVSLDYLLRESDFISIHCPLNEGTRHLVGTEAFEKMAKKPIIINTSRGPIIAEKALIAALQAGQVSGAGLDVLEKEPPDSASPLMKMGNVVLSPHVGFYSAASISELKRRTARNVAEVLTGKWPAAVVNKEVRGKTRAHFA